MGCTAPVPLCREELGNADGTALPLSVTRTVSRRGLLPGSEQGSPAQSQVLRVWARVSLGKLQRSPAAHTHLFRAVPRLGLLSSQNLPLPLCLDLHLPNLSSSHKTQVYKKNGLCDQIHLGETASDSPVSPSHSDDPGLWKVGLERELSA